MNTPRLLAYPAYKPSGVPWLGDVPEHWELRRGKALLAPVDVRSTTGDEELLTVSAQRGVVPRATASVTMFKAESYVGYKLCWPGDLVINSLWAWAHGLGVSQWHGIVSSAYGVYRPLPKVHPRFIHLLTRSVPFQWELQVRSKGIWVSRLQLTDEAFLGAPFPLPPLPEQAAIVRYLDYVDGRIRRYVDAKERLVGLLEEERQAVVNRAVTRGLDPNVRLKPSGVDWLGDVPEHWEVRRLRTVVEMRVSNVDKHTKEDEFLIRLCNYVDVYKYDRITQAMPFMTATASWDEIERFRLERDDVLITKDSEAWDDIGVPALVVEPADDLISGYHLALLRPYKEMIGAYLARTLQSKAVAYQFHVRANGVTRYGLTHAGIKSVLVPLPPLPEQRGIVKYLNKTTTEIDYAIARAHLQIELIEEYRTRLIADVVTGKLDVREAAGVASNGRSTPYGASFWSHLTPFVDVTTLQYNRGQVLALGMGSA